MRQSTLNRHNSHEEKAVLSPDEIRAIRFVQILRAAGIFSFLGAVCLFAFTQFTLTAILVLAAGFVILAGRKLIQKSLALTAGTGNSQADSTVVKLEQIRKLLSKCRFMENAEAEGTQLATQADLLLFNYKQLSEVLSRKFESSEITFQRYAEGIDSSCLAIGENLLHMKNVLENLNLKSRLNENRESENQVTEMLGKTEQAISHLSELFHSLNNINTNEKHRDQLEQSMQQIRELASRAQIYSRH